MVEMLAVAAMLLYAVVAVSVVIGGNKEIPRDTRLQSVSVVIAAHNEAENIGRLLNSLAQQDYPSELWECILINDRSTDRTLEIIEEYKNRIPNLALIDIVEKGIRLSGKMNALAVGMKNVRREIVILTDADCQLPPEFIRERVQSFADEVVLVGGPVIIDEAVSPGIFTVMQGLDWLYLGAVAGGLTQLNFPSSIFGNNLSFRKTVYDAIGGYEALPFTVTEDFALVQAFHQRGSGQIRFSQDNKNGMVITQPEKTVRQFMRQRIRWVSGGKKAPGVAGIAGAISIFANGLALFNIFILGWPGLALLGFLILMDGTILWPVLRKAGKAKWFIWLPLYKLFQISYTFVLAVFLVLPLKIRWKDQIF